jgi:hypothetical protein
LRNLPGASHIILSFPFVAGRRRRDNKCERGRKEEVEVEIKWVALLVLSTPLSAEMGREDYHDEATHLKQN